jgi:hypothetical protein
LALTRKNNSKLLQVRNTGELLGLLEFSQFFYQQTV